MRSPRGFRGRVALGIVLIVLGISIAHITISVVRETRLLRADLIALGEVRAGGLADRVVLPLLAQNRAELEREIGAATRTPTTLGIAVLRRDGEVLSARGSLAPLTSAHRAGATPSWSELSDRIRFVAPVRLAAGSRPPSEFEEEGPVGMEVVGS